MFLVLLQVTFEWMLYYFRADLRFIKACLLFSKQETIRNIRYWSVLWLSLFTYNPGSLAAPVTMLLLLWVHICRHAHDFRIAFAKYFAKCWTISSKLDCNISFNFIKANGYALNTFNYCISMESKHCRKQHWKVDKWSRCLNLLQFALKKKMEVLTVLVGTQMSLSEFSCIMLLLHFLSPNEIVDVLDTKIEVVLLCGCLDQFFFNKCSTNSNALRASVTPVSLCNILQGL